MIPVSSIHLQESTLVGVGHCRQKQPAGEVYWKGGENYNRLHQWQAEASELAHGSHGLSTEPP